MKASASLTWNTSWIRKAVLPRPQEPRIRNFRGHSSLISHHSPFCTGFETLVEINVDLARLLKNDSFAFRVAADGGNNIAHAEGK